VSVVLGRGPDHRRPTDVEHVHRAGGPAVFERCRVGPEGIGVDHHEVERLDAVRLHVGTVIGVGGIGQDPAVDAGVQRHHPVTEDGREPGQLGGVGDGKAGGGERLRCAPG
jgi:hypothetical protein